MYPNYNQNPFPPLGNFNPQPASSYYVPQSQNLNNLNNFPGYQRYQPSPPQVSANQASSKQKLQEDVSRKKEKIISWYKLIFGRIPSESDLSTLLQSKLPEIEIVKKMLSDSEHLEVLNARNEIINSRIENERLKKEMEDMQLKQVDLENTNKGWEELVADKSNEIRELDQQIQNFNLELEKARNKIIRLEEAFNSKFSTKIKNIFDRIVDKIVDR